MSISNSISRLADYYSRHGLAATIRRARLAVKRALFAGRTIIFYCDLNEQRPTLVYLSNSLRVERLTALTELSAERLREMTSFWNPKLASRNIRERFGKGASLWLVTCEGRLAGYGWTLQGCTMEPYYFPLAQDDVHLFDFHVFPNYRGRGLNPYLVRCILDALAINGKGRAFIEAGEWNEAQLSSLRKTPFRCLGSVRTFRVLGRSFVSWSSGRSRCGCPEGAEPDHRLLRATGTNTR